MTSKHLLFAQSYNTSLWKITLKYVFRSIISLNSVNIFITEVCTLIICLIIFSLAFSVESISSTFYFT